MDAASDASKRRLLANHLREVIDVLEQKGDQIASLYDLLHFEDKPLSSMPASNPGPSTSKVGRR
jgi:Centrosome microtubule-binding domain of Cep57